MKSYELARKRHMLLKFILFALSASMCLAMEKKDEKEPTSQGNSSSASSSSSSRSCSSASFLVSNSAPCSEAPISLPPEAAKDHKIGKEACDQVINIGVASTEATHFHKFLQLPKVLQERILNEYLSPASLYPHLWFQTFTAYLILYFI